MFVVFDQSNLFFLLVTFILIIEFVICLMLDMPYMEGINISNFPDLVF